MIPQSSPLCALEHGRVEAGGFTLIESVMSILIVGLMLVAALNTVGASRLSQMKNTEQVIGPPLAEDLMTEILIQSYEEPDDTVNFGRESGESGGDRTDWDDVDDYDGHSSSPPEAKGGAVLPGLDGWTRKVAVNWAETLAPQNNAILPSGIKRIKVEVLHQGRVVTTMTALRSNAWPDSNTPSLPPINVLMVVDDPAAISTAEAERKALLESLGCVVSVIKERWGRTEFDDAAANNDVIFVPSHITRDGNAKLETTTIGVVAESEAMVSVLGFANRSANGGNSKTITLISNGHYTTSPFSVGLLTLLTSNSALIKLSGASSNDMRVLGTIGLDVCLATLEIGDDRYDNSTSPGRRVILPWCKSGFDITSLNDNGKTLLQRSLEWAAGKERPD